MDQSTSPQAQNRKLSQHALETIRSKIISGEYAFGRKLLEADLAELLGVSKSPIREALLQLSREGLVDVAPSRSAQVFTMTAAEIRDLTELRKTLELKAIQLAAERNPGPLVQELDDVVEQMRTAVKEGDTKKYKLLDDEFHQSIFQSCGNSYFQTNFELLSHRIQALRYRLSDSEALNVNSLKEHEDILSALREERVEDARDFLADHIDHMAKNFLLWLEATDANGPRQIDGAGASSGTKLVPVEDMERFSREILAAVNADDPTINAVTKAVMHASVHGVDTHGVRLLPHYVKVIAGGRVNSNPQLRFSDGPGAVAVLDADDAHGARATYAAMDHAIGFARASGIGAVAIRASSHFGAAGAYAIEAARANMVGLAFCNSDAFVRLHGGAEPFHGTNPIAAAAPVNDDDPWLLDMATSSIPVNRVELSRALNIELPPEVASDENGKDTTDPHQFGMLAPLGGKNYGYKGAGLAGLSEILSSAFGNTPLSIELPSMASEDVSTPRNLGAFVIAIDPNAFGGLTPFLNTMTRYLSAVRASRTAAGGVVMAPGDREWKEAKRRRQHGIIVDATSFRSFQELADKHALEPLKSAD